MRFITFIFLFLISFSTAHAKDKNKDKDKKPKVDSQLIGTWITVKQEMNGKAFPDVIVKSQKMVIEDTLYTVTAESVDKGVIRYGTDNKMDIYGKEGVNKGQHFMAIYKYQNDTLTICYNLAGKTYPESFETKGKNLFLLSVFKKEGVK